MSQEKTLVPLYDHLDRFDELGRKRGLRRYGRDPDQAASAQAADSLTNDREALMERNLEFVA